MRRITRVLVSLALTAGVLVGCGSDGSSNGVDLSGKRFEKEKGTRAVTVEAVDNKFEPAYVTVSTGTTVTFDNTGHNRHNVISVEDGFESITSPFTGGESHKVTFDAAGDYPYYCSLHGTAARGMAGAIRVVE